MESLPFSPQTKVFSIGSITIIPFFFNISSYFDVIGFYLIKQKKKKRVFLSSQNFFIVNI